MPETKGNESLLAGKDIRQAELSTRPSTSLALLAILGRIHPQSAMTGNPDRDAGEKDRLQPGKASQLPNVEECGKIKKVKGNFLSIYHYF
jgi:hypothetical protein